MKPAIALRGVGLIQAIFNKGKMGAQRLRQVGVGLGQLNQQGNQLRQRRAPAALFPRNANRAEPRFLQPANLLVGQNTVLFAVRGSLRNARENRPESRGQLFIIGTGRE